MQLSILCTHLQQNVPQLDGRIAMAILGVERFKQGTAFSFTAILLLHFEDARCASFDIQAMISAPYRLTVVCRADDEK